MRSSKDASTRSPLTAASVLFAYIPVLVRTLGSIVESLDGDGKLARNARVVSLIMLAIGFHFDLLAS